MDGICDTKYTIAGYNIERCAKKQFMPLIVCGVENIEKRNC
jgi:hypothetical protein